MLPADIAIFREKLSHLNKELVIITRYSRQIKSIIIETLNPDIITILEFKLHHFDHKCTQHTHRNILIENLDLLSEKEFTDTVSKFRTLVKQKKNFGNTIVFTCNRREVKSYPDCDVIDVVTQVSEQPDVFKAVLNIYSTPLSVANLSRIHTQIKSPNLLAFNLAKPFVYTSVTKQDNCAKSIAAMMQMFVKSSPKEMITPQAKFARFIQFVFSTYQINRIASSLNVAFIDKSLKPARKEYTITRVNDKVFSLKDYEFT